MLESLGGLRGQVCGERVSSRKEALHTKLCDSKPAARHAKHPAVLNLKGADTSKASPVSLLTEQKNYRYLAR